MTKETTPFYTSCLFHALISALFLLPFYGLAQEKRPLVRLDTNHIKSWLVSECFQKSKATDETVWDVDYLKDQGGEANIHPTDGMTHKRADGSVARWFLHDTGRYDHIDLKKLLLPRKPVYGKRFSYLYTIIACDQPGDYYVLMGYDWGCQVWLNGRDVHRCTNAGAFVEDSAIAKVTLKKGENRFLMKVYGRNELVKNFKTGRYVEAWDDWRASVRFMPASQFKKLSKAARLSSLGAALSDESIGTVNLLLRTFPELQNTPATSRSCPYTRLPFDELRCSLDRKGCKNLYYPIHNVVRKGQKGLFTVLLNAGVDINQRTSVRKKTPLHVAIEWDKMDMFKLLLERGANVDIKDYQGVPPLFFALRYKRFEMVDLLLKAGADVKCRAAGGEGIKTYAALSGNSKYEAMFPFTDGDVKWISKGGWTACHSLAAGGFTQKLKRFLKAGAPADIPLTYNGYTPLIFTARSKHSKIVKALLQQDVNINHQDSNGRTPLYHAVLAQNPSSEIRALIAAGAMDLPSAAGNTALHLACSSSVSDSSEWWGLNVEELLMGQDTDPNSPNRDFVTPFMCFCSRVHQVTSSQQSHYLKLAQRFLEKGALTNLVERSNYSAMVYAGENTPLSAQLKKWVDKHPPTPLNEVYTNRLMAKSKLDSAKILAKEGNGLVLVALGDVDSSLMNQLKDVYEKLLKISVVIEKGAIPLNVFPTQTTKGRVQINAPNGINYLRDQVGFHGNPRIGVICITPNQLIVPGGRNPYSTYTERGIALLSYYNFKKNKTKLITQIHQNTFYTFSRMFGLKLCRSKRCLRNRKLLNPCEACRQKLNAHFGVKGKDISQQDLKFRDLGKLTTQRRTILKHHKNKISALAIHPRHSVLVAGSSDGSISVWDVPKKSLMKSYAGHSHPILSLAIHPEQKLVVSVDRGKYMLLWNFTTATTVHTFPKMHDTPMQVAFTPGGQELVYVSGRTATIIDVSSRQTKRTLTFPSRLRACCISADGTRLAVAGPNGKIFICDMKGTFQPKALEGHQFGVRSLQFGHTANELFSGSNDLTIRHWNLKKATSKSYVAHDSLVLTVSFDASRQKLYSADYDGKVIEWFYKDSSLIQKRVFYFENLYRFTYSGMNGLLIGGLGDGDIQLETLQEPKDLKKTIDDR